MVAGPVEVNRIILLCVSSQCGFHMDPAWDARRIKMNRYLSLTAFIAATFLYLFLPSPATADPIPIIQYQATDLPDLVPSADLWQYTYTLSYSTADTFLQNQAFAILFDENLYSGLEDPPPSVTDWFVFVFQPDLGGPYSGEYDAIAEIDDPSIAGKFGLNFIWMGGAGTAPGSQPFVVNEFNSDGNWVREIGTGETIIPEPATALLLATGLIAGAILYRKRG